MSQPFISAIVVAAGGSTRMGEGINKQMIMLGGAPVLAHSILAFDRNRRVDEIVVVTRSEDIMEVGALVKAFFADKVRTVVAGGNSRQESVAKGVNACDPQAEYYLIHDGARPLVTDETVDDVIDGALRYGAAAAAVAVKDTIKRADAKMTVERTVEREGLYQVQTPQMFAAPRYREALARALREAVVLTDDCQLFEREGLPVYLCKGDYANIKITTPEDVACARALLRLRAENNNGR